MKKQPLIALALTATATIANAGLKYECRNNNLERFVEVVSPAGSPVPCSVDYTKETGEKKSLWRANTDADYCITKAADFIEKQRSWGWSCSMTK